MNAEERIYLALRSVRDPLLRPVVALLAAMRVSPEILSLAGIICMGAFLYVIPEDPFTALLFLIAAIVIDALDGNLARFLGVDSDAGKFTDVLADNICFTLFVIGLAEASLIPATVGIAYAYFMLLAKVLMIVRKNMNVVSDWLIRPMVGAYPNVFVFASYGLFALYAIRGTDYLAASSTVFAALLAAQCFVSYLLTRRIIVRASRNGRRSGFGASA